MYKERYKTAKFIDFVNFKVQKSCLSMTIHYHWHSYSESLCSFSKFSISCSLTSTASDTDDSVTSDSFSTIFLLHANLLYTEFITTAGNVRFHNLLNNNPAALNKRSTAADDTGTANTTFAPAFSSGNLCSFFQ